MAAGENFILTVCQVGAERALKQEMAREHAALRPAFARPGLVTFKSPGAPVAADVAIRSVFARAFAAALGPARGAGEVLEVANRVRGDRALRLHVWERDAARPGDERASDATPARVIAVRDALLAAAGAPFLVGEIAQAGEHVLDVVVAGEEPLFVAHHLHSLAHSPHAGGRIPVDVPPEAPSRAYRKIEEALAWSGAPVRAGQVAVEIGSAPGGASYALVRRGLEVVGVDPGAMDPRVLASPRFHHVQLPVGEVRAKDLPAHVDWLVLDVNLAPQVALHAVRGVVAELRPSLRGLLFTLKLNDWAMAAEVPELLRRIEAMGFGDVRATQLPSNRQEIFACAWASSSKSDVVGDVKAGPRRRR